MEIAVVILNWNGMLLLEKFLPSIVEYSTEATVYVVDNASTDDSVSFLEVFYPSVKNDSNLGFASGYNESLKYIKADIYALVNSDIEVTKNWLQPILSTFEKEPKTAIIQPKILDFKQKQYFEYAGAAGGYIDQYGYPYCRGRIFETLEKEYPFHQKVTLENTYGMHFYSKFKIEKSFLLAFLSYPKAGGQVYRFQRVSLCLAFRHLPSRILFLLP